MSLSDDLTLEVNHGQRETRKVPNLNARRILRRTRRHRTALGRGGADRVRLDRDPSLDRLRLAVHEQNVRDLNRLLVGTADFERQIAGAPYQDDVMKKILASPLEHQAIGACYLRDCAHIDHVGADFHLQAPRVD